MAKKKQNKTTLLILLAVAALALLFSYIPSLLGGETDIPAKAVAADFAVHFIDVGQGDSILVSANGQHMLIDGGERGNEERVVKYLKDQGVERLEIVIATHPHSDHIGGLAYGVLDAFPVGTVITPQFLPENVPTTQSYEQFLQAVGRLKRQGAAARFAKPGMEYALGEPGLEQAVVQIMGPLKEDGENYNNDSVITRVQYGNVSVLLTGDAEKGVEGQLVKRWGAGLQSTFMKAGHHGSGTSSTAVFLDAVKPQTIAISSGVGNSYGHPHAQMLERCRGIGIRIFRTDTDGTIVFGSDGRDFWRVEI